MDFIYNIVTTVLALWGLLVIVYLSKLNKWAKKQHGIPREWQTLTCKIFGLQQEEWGEENSLYMQQIIRVVKDTKEIVKDKEGNTLNLKGLLVEEKVGFDVELTILDEKTIQGGLYEALHPDRDTMH